MSDYSQPTLMRWAHVALIPFLLLLLAGCSLVESEAQPPVDSGSAQESNAEATNTTSPTATIMPTATVTQLPATSTPITTTAQVTVTSQLTETFTNSEEITTTLHYEPGDGNGPGELLTATVSITTTENIPTIDPAAVNGILIDEIVVMPDEVKENVRQIYARGQALGRNSHGFSKLGDSLIATSSFLTQFDTGNYDLGEFADLQPAIDYYTGSYERYGVALRPGLHAWGVFDPLWANKDWCQANENLLACEFRLNNPGVLLVLLGTNDAGNPPGFDYNMRKVIEYSIENGVIPIIVTKADRFEGPDNTNNEILRQIAADYLVPLWDFDLVAGTIPGRGLLDDQVHLTVFVENDYTMPEAFQTGTGLHNLTGLMALDAVRQVIGQ